MFFKKNEDSFFPGKNILTKDPEGFDGAIGEILAQPSAVVGEKKSAALNWSFGKAVSSETARYRRQIGRKDKRRLA